MESYPGNKNDPLVSVRLALQNEAFVCDVLCCCVVAGCFFLYLHYALTHTLVYTDDFQKQYLIANHIARFREFPFFVDARDRMRISRRQVSLLAGCRPLRVRAVRVQLCICPAARRSTEHFRRTSCSLSQLPLARP